MTTMRPTGRRVTKWAAAVALLAAAASGQSSARAADAGSALKDGDHVAVVGDSITEQKQYSAFIEAYLVACAESTGIRRVVSFDRSIDRVSTIERIEP